MKKTFVFVDESGNNSQEDLFAIGCVFVPADKIGEYYDLLSRARSRILTTVNNKEKQLTNTLSQKDLINFYKGRRRSYEIKFKNINQTVVKEYRSLLYAYFKCTDIRFVCFVTDKKDGNKFKGKSFYDTYIKHLIKVLEVGIKNGEEIVLLPDNITISKKENYEKRVVKDLKAKGKNIFGVHRLESHASLFIQISDLLTGASLHTVKNDFQKYKSEISDLINSKCMKAGDNFQINIDK